MTEKPVEIAASLTETAGKVALDLTNVFGLVEKNINSFDNIKSAFKRKRLHQKLCLLLESLTELRGLNEVTIWSIASEVRDSQRVGNFQELMAGMEANPYAGKDLESFGLAILETRDILDELKSDLIAVDYKLYEDLMDNIEARQLTFSILKDSELGSFSKQKLTDLYQAYEDLIKSLQLCKDRVQEKTKDTQA